MKRPSPTPWNKGFIESFNHRLRKESLNRNHWTNLLEARVAIADFKHEHNSAHRHSALGYLTPAEYAAQRSHTHYPAACDINRNSVSTIWPLKPGGATIWDRSGPGIRRVTSTYSSQTLERLREHREAIRNVLARYGASNPRLFGSIAQGTAGPDSDVDLVLDLAAEGSGSRLSRLSGIRLELEELLKLPSTSSARNSSKTLYRNRLAARPLRCEQIGAMRNFLIHEYFNIDEAVVEDVIANDLDPLKVAVNVLLDAADDT